MPTVHATGRTVAAPACDLEDGAAVAGLRTGMLLPVYVPTAFLAFGQGLLIPTLPVYAASFGVPFTLVSVAVGAAAIGTLLTDLPAGILIGRFGRKPVMLIGTLLVALSLLAIGLAQTFPLLILFRLTMGAGTALWGISRHAYIADVVPPAQRGRSIAVFGGINRVGAFAGPAVGGGVAWAFGLNAPFLLGAVMALAALLVSAVAIRETAHETQAAHRAVRWQIVGALLRESWRDLAGAGVAQTFAQMIRAGRQLIIPLYGTYVVGLDVAAIGTIVSAGSVVDMLLFMPAGMIMDRFGRKFAAVPSFAILAIGMALIPLTHDFTALLATSVLIGFGNGIGSGTMMTLGADLAPPGAMGEFLGLWRLIGDTGGAGGPIIVGVLADAVGLALTALALCGVGLAAAGLMAALVRETRHQPMRPSTSP
jgi:MFS family permease